MSRPLSVALARKLQSSRRRLVDPDGVRGEVEVATLRPGIRLPLVVRAWARQLDLADWIRRERETLETQLLEHGGILFRGFRVDGPDGFHNAATAYSPALFGEYGDLPREPGTAPIYRSTPYPPEKPILFHNEASHTHRWPMTQWFFCVTPSTQGGETPIADCRAVYQRLDRRLLDRFEEKGLLYVRNFLPGLDVSWQAFFGTDDRSSLETACRKAAVGFEWRGPDHLQIRHRCPAIRRHPKTGERLFFNQVQLHHVSCLDPQVRESLRALFPEQELPRNVYYGDGSPIEDDTMAAITRTYREVAVEFRWERSDVLVLDNMLTAHARNPFAGARKILVAMSDMVEPQE